MYYSMLLWKYYYNYYIINIISRCLYNLLWEEPRISSVTGLPFIIFNIYNLYKMLFLFLWFWTQCGWFENVQENLNNHSTYCRMNSESSKMLPYNFNENRNIEKHCIMLESELIKSIDYVKPLGIIVNSRLMFDHYCRN